MSRSNSPDMSIGCPRCDETVTATVPPGPGLGAAQDDSNRLRGKETVCRNCGHELELYYY